MTGCLGLKNIIWQSPTVVPKMEIPGTYLWVAIFWSRGPMFPLHKPYPYYTAYMGFRQDAWMTRGAFYGTAFKSSLKKMASQDTPKIKWCFNKIKFIHQNSIHLGNSASSRDLFGMVSSRDPNSKANRDLQLGDKKVTN